MGPTVKGINSDVENPAVEKIDRKDVERGKSVTRTGNWITEIKKICDVQQGPYLQMWNSIFVISCVFAVSLDPLFFYVVNVDRDKKCLHSDKKLKIVALVMRSLTDIIFLVHLICEISYSIQKTVDKKSKNTPKNEPSEAVEQTRGNSGEKWKDRELIQYVRKIAQNISWLSIIIDVLALLPLPQLIILMFYPKEGSGFVEHKMFVNVFLLGQYVPRIFRIHLSAKVFKRMNGIWAKGLFNLFLYLLAGHVLGAFWYISSIQREASCWHEACIKLNIACSDTFCVGCKDSFYCKVSDSGVTSVRYNIKNGSCPLGTLDAGSTNTRNIIRQQTGSCPLGTKDDENNTRNIIEHLNKNCPLDTLDGAVSPFNFGIFLDSLKNENPDQKFGKKFLYSFCNFGTNLVTSTYVWENLFAILISVSGLLLFIYLIGNVQAFVQMGATKTEEMRRQREKIKEAKNTLTKIPMLKDMDEKVLKMIQIPMLKDMDEKVLKMMCDYLRPATYIENSFIFRTGDPLDCMLFIIEGTMWTYASSDSHAGQGISSMAIKPLRKGDFYGEELLDWASDFTEVPVSSKHVKSHTKVEAFVLMAEDLVSPLGPHGDLLDFNNPEEVKKMTLSAFLRFHTKAQRRQHPSLPEIGDNSSGTLPSAASN